MLLFYILAKKSARYDISYTAYDNVSGKQEVSYKLRRPSNKNHNTPIALYLIPTMERYCTHGCDCSYRFGSEQGWTVTTVGKWEYRPVRPVSMRAKQGNKQAMSVLWYL